MKAKKIFKIVILTFLAIITPILSFTNSIAYAEVGSNNQEVVKYIDTQINSFVEKKAIKGAIVSIVDNGEIVLNKGYGYADEKNNVKVDPQKTTFKLGSISKTFVALAALQLREQGKLDMKAPISEYLEPDFPKFKYPITMENLLTHTAGFEEKYSSIVTALEVNETEKEIMQLRDFVRCYMPAQIYQPGEVYAYSNYGVALAGYVIEKITGQEFYDYAEDNIFKPLHMVNTTFRQSRLGIPSKAYSPEGNEKNEISVISYPAGSLSSTAQDMSEYMKFLLDSKNEIILKDNDKQDMFNKHFAMSDELPGSGYIWERQEVNGHVYYSHSGGTAIFVSNLAIYPEQNLGIFMSFNQSSINELAECYSQVEEMLYGKEKQLEAYTVTNTRDISGWYIPARSVFKGSDKFIDLIMGLLSGYPKQITGNTKDGFSIDGEKLVYVGEDAYQNINIGYLKFTEKNGKLYYSTKEDSGSFLRVPWICSNTWHIFVLLTFIVIGFIGLIISMIRIITALVKRKGKNYILTSIPLTTAFLLFASMIGRLVYHINYATSIYGDLNSTAGFPGVIIFFKIASALIAISAFCGVASTIYLWIKKKGIILRVFYSVWSVSSVLLTIWLMQMNLIG